MPLVRALARTWCQSGTVHRLKPPAILVKNYCNFYDLYGFPTEVRPSSVSKGSVMGWWVFG
jgi:hypothetical protein